MQNKEKLINELVKLQSTKEEAVFLSEDVAVLIDKLGELKELEDENGEIILKYEKIREYKNGSLIKITLTIYENNNAVVDDKITVDVKLWQTKNNKYIPLSYISKLIDDYVLYNMFNMFK